MNAWMVCTDECLEIMSQYKIVENIMQTSEQREVKQYEVEQTDLQQ